MSVLLGRTALIVEDEAILAMMAEDCLLDFGMTVVGIAGGIDEAMSLLETVRPDVAVVDLNLNGRLALPVIVRLSELGIACLVVTGYGEDGGSAGIPSVPVLAKPYNVPSLRGALERLLQVRHPAANGLKN